MPILPMTPPQIVRPAGGFDYVTVDAQRRRVYAAHGGADSLLIADADTGKVLGQVKVGPMHGVAVEPSSGHVFTGNGTDNSVSEVDPVTMTVLRTVGVAGPVDAIAYDPGLSRIYADEDDGTRIFVIDAKSFKSIATVTLPGHKPEYIQVDPQTHEVYQNIADLAEIAVVDPNTLAVSRIIPTPELKSNHPLQYDPVHHVLLAAGENGVLGVYDRATGRLLYQAVYPGGVDQCSLDAERGRLACAGGGITLFAFDGSSAPRLIAQYPVARGFHTDAIDPLSGTIFGVWSDKASGDAYFQSFNFR